MLEHMGGGGGISAGMTTQSKIHQLPEYSSGLSINLFDGPLLQCRRVCVCVCFCFSHPHNLEGSVDVGGKGFLKLILLNLFAAFFYTLWGNLPSE